MIIVTIPGEVHAFGFVIVSIPLRVHNFIFIFIMSIPLIVHNFWTLPLLCDIFIRSDRSQFRARDLDAIVIIEYELKDARS